MGSAKRRKKKRSLMPILALIVLILVLAVPTVYLTSDDVNLDFISRLNKPETENNETGMPDISETDELSADNENDRMPGEDDAFAGEDDAFAEEDDAFAEEDDALAEEDDAFAEEDDALHEESTASLQDDVYDDDMDEPDHDIESNEPVEDSAPEMPVKNTGPENQSRLSSLLASLVRGEVTDAAVGHGQVEDRRVTEKNAEEENIVTSLPDTRENHETLSSNAPGSNVQRAELNIEQDKPLKDHEEDAIEINAKKESATSPNQLITQNNITAESNGADTPPVDEPAIKEELNTTDTIEDTVVSSSDALAADKQENLETAVTASEPVAQVVPEITLAFKEDALHDLADKDRMENELSSTLKEMYVTYEEPFNDNSNNWHIFDTGTVSAKIKNGYYVIENNNHATTHIILHQHDFPHHLDFIIEATVQTERSEGDYSYGYVFGARDTRNYLALQVKGNRVYAINKSKDGKTEEIASGGIMDAPVNNDSPVTLKIERRGNDILFYVSNRFIGTLQDFEFTGKKIGFIVEGNAMIAIDKTRSQIRYQNQ